MLRTIAPPSLSSRNLRAANKTSWFLGCSAGSEMSASAAYLDSEPWPVAQEVLESTRAVPLQNDRGSRMRHPGGSRLPACGNGLEPTLAVRRPRLDRASPVSETDQALSELQRREGPPERARLHASDRPRFEALRNAGKRGTALRTRAIAIDREDGLAGARPDTRATVSSPRSGKDTEMIQRRIGLLEPFGEEACRLSDDPGFRCGLGQGSCRRPT